MTEALAGGNGVILALPHLGGWEWAGRWMTDQGHQMTVVVEPLDPPELFEWFVDLRKDLGMTVVPLGPKAGAAVLKALRSNEVVCLLCDRDLDRTGVEVEFFGERTTLPAGPATLSLRTGAPLLPAGVYFTPRYNGHHACRAPARADASPRRRPARRRRARHASSWRTSSSSSSAAPPSSGTCSNPTGPATPATDLGAGRRLDRLDLGAVVTRW